MLGSTLIPTAIHFLIASLAGFLALNRQATKNTATKLRMALEEVSHYDNPLDRDAIAVDSDARFAAFWHLYVAPLLVVVVWLVVVAVIGSVLFEALPYAVQELLSWFGGPPPPVTFWL